MTMSWWVAERECRIPMKCPSINLKRSIALSRIDGVTMTLLRDSTNESTS